MPKQSAGLLMYRYHEGLLQVLLGHPGGPYFRNREEAVWSVPKGEAAPGESLLAAAKREFEEETGLKPVGPFLPLSPLVRKDRKHLYAWAFEGDCDVSSIRSNRFLLEWPPRSGRQAEFPEMDRAAFFDIEAARRKITPAQQAWIEELPQRLRDLGKPVGD